MNRARTTLRMLPFAALCVLAAMTLTDCTKESPPSTSSTSTNAVGPSLPSGFQGVLVVINRKPVAPNPSPKHPKLSRGMDAMRTSICWFNASGAPMTLDFTTGWPFDGAQRPITIAPNQFSDVFTMVHTGPSAVYPYHLTPDVSDSSGPPGDPDVTAEP